MTKVTLAIDGMSCEMCSGKVGESLKSVNGVSKVSVDLGKGRAAIEHDGSVKDADLVKAVVDCGFTAKVKRGLF